jgi:hypothetical protein
VHPLFWGAISKSPSFGLSLFFDLFRYHSIPAFSHLFHRALQPARLSLRSPSIQHPTFAANTIATGSRYSDTFHLRGTFNVASLVITSVTRLLALHLHLSIVLPNTDILDTPQP